MSDVTSSSEDVDEEKTKMNLTLWKLLSTKIKKHGDIGRLADELGVSRQTLSNIENNRSYPASETMGRIKRLFPGFSADAIYTGQPAGKSEANEASSDGLSELIQIRAELAEMRKLLRERDETILELKDEVKEWQRAYRSLAEQKFGFDQPGVKIGSSSRPTAKAQKQGRTFAVVPEPIGFRQGKLPLPMKP